MTSPSLQSQARQPNRRHLYTLIPTILFLSLLSLPLAAAQPSGGSAQENSSSPKQVEYPNAIKYQVLYRAIYGKSTPYINIIPQIPLKRASYTITRNDGNVIKGNLGKMGPNRKKKIVIPQPKGAFQYTMHIDADFTKNRHLDKTFTFDIAYGDELKVDSTPSDLDLPNRTISFRLSRPAYKAVISFLNKNGEVMNTFTKDISNDGTDISLTWPEVSENVDKLNIRVLDENGFYSETTLDPFWIEIPHQELQFDNGLATWQPVEEPKLRETLKDLKKLVKHHKSKRNAPFQFYIAGYTDTVGASDFNQTLSQSRADAIARWFLAHGIDIPIYTQGFGEDALLIDTPDDTPNASNRRALYLLGTSRPELSKNFPRGNWKRVN